MADRPWPTNDPLDVPVVQENSLLLSKDEIRVVRRCPCGKALSVPWITKYAGKVVQCNSCSAQKGD